nr:hypothetical protein [Akkermansia glycaniphila]
MARKPARYHVNKTSPQSSVKCANIIPNRERRDRAVILPGGKDGGGIRIDLDGADGAPSEEVAAEYAAASACE